MQLYGLIVGASSIGVRGKLGLSRTPPTRASSILSGKDHRRTTVQQHSQVPIPAPETGGTAPVDNKGLQSWNVEDKLPLGTLPLTLSASSVLKMDATSQVESTAPELLPLWLRHGHQVPEKLVHDLQLGGVVAAVSLCEVLDRVSLRKACEQAMLGLPDAASGCIEDLLCLQLKLSYLSTKTPLELKNYTHARDAEDGIARRGEAALLARLSSEQAFPCGGDPAAVLPFLVQHLDLKLSETDPQAWETVEETFKRAHPWAVRTECLLVEGCDDRITVPYSLGKTTNKYHCSPVPTPEVVSRSSCTSNSTSRRAFHSADAKRHEMLLTWALAPRGAGSLGGREFTETGTGAGNTQGFDNRMGDVRRRLLDVLGVDQKTGEAFLTPSGSDAELLPTALARVRSRRLGHQSADGPAVTAIVVAAGEVGSGTAGASGGKHFSALTPRGVPGYPEQHVEGMFDDDVIVVQIKPRSQTGAFIPCEENVNRAVLTAMSSSQTSVAVVHAVVGSKTGICTPSIDSLVKLQERYGERVLVVVDACQLRIEAESMSEYAALGFLTLVTGSKFYCGPPFCGAVLFPRAALVELEAGQQHLPAGFGDYFTRHEVDPRYSALRSRLPAWENHGLLLRWASSLDNMEAVKNIPKDRLRSFVVSWVAGVRDSVLDKWPYLSLLPEQRESQPCKILGGVNTVVPVVVRVPRISDGSGGNPDVALGYDDLRLFHRLLSEDITALLPSDLGSEDRASARLRVLLGQPVKLGGASFGVVRIALGADMLIDAFYDGNPPMVREESGAMGHDGVSNALLDQDRVAVNKCSVMARHWHHLKEAAIGTSAMKAASQANNLKEMAANIESMGEEDLRILQSLISAREGKLHIGGALRGS